MKKPATTQLIAVVTCACTASANKDGTLPEHGCPSANACNASLQCSTGSIYPHSTTEQSSVCRHKDSVAPA